MRYKQLNENITLESFDSVREFTRVSATRTPNDAFSKRAYLSSQSTSRRKWYGTSSFDAANKLMSKGYKEGCKDLLNCKDGIKVMNEDIKTRTIKNYAGFAPCVPAALMGIPKTMYQKKKQVQKTPVINLYFDSGVHCGIDTDTMILGGKNLYSLCNYLDSRNIRVNLFIFIGVHIQGKKDAFLTIKVKKIRYARKSSINKLPYYPPFFLPPSYI